MLLDVRKMIICEPCSVCSFVRALIINNSITMIALNYLRNLHLHVPEMSGSLVQEMYANGKSVGVCEHCTRGHLFK